MTAGTGTITLDSSSDLMSYTKIGNTVFCRGQLNTSGVSSPTGALNIGGLPFTVGTIDESADHQSGSVWATGFGIVLNGHMVLRLLNGNTAVNLFDNNGQSISDMADHVDASTQF
jgi:hypothetical protein